MKAYSLRLRLLAGAAVAIFAALAVAWMAMTWLFERQLERRVEQELRRGALQLAGGPGGGANRSTPAPQSPDHPRFEMPARGLSLPVRGPWRPPPSRSFGG